MPPRSLFTSGWRPVAMWFVKDTRIEITTVPGWSQIGAASRRTSESYAGTARLSERRSATRGSKRVESSVGSGEFT